MNNILEDLLSEKRTYDKWIDRFKKFIGRRSREEVSSKVSNMKTTELVSFVSGVPEKSAKRVLSSSEFEMYELAKAELEKRSIKEDEQGCYNVLDIAEDASTGGNGAGTGPADGSGDGDSSTPAPPSNPRPSRPVYYPYYVNRRRRHRRRSKYIVKYDKTTEEFCVVEEDETDFCISRHANEKTAQKEADRLNDERRENGRRRGYSRYDY